MHVHGGERDDGTHDRRLIAPEPRGSAATQGKPEGLHGLADVKPAPLRGDISRLLAETQNEGSADKFCQDVELALSGRIQRPTATHATAKGRHRRSNASLRQATTPRSSAHARSTPRPSRLKCCADCGSYGSPCVVAGLQQAVGAAGGLTP